MRPPFLTLLLTALLLTGSVIGACPPAKDVVLVPGPAAPDPNTAVERVDCSLPGTCSFAPLTPDEPVSILRPLWRLPDR